MQQTVLILADISVVFAAPTHTNAVYVIMYRCGCCVHDMCSALVNINTFMLSFVRCRQLRDHHHPQDFWWNIFFGLDMASSLVKHGHLGYHHLYNATVVVVVLAAAVSASCRVISEVVK